MEKEKDITNDSGLIDGAFLQVPAFNGDPAANFGSACMSNYDTYPPTERRRSKSVHNIQASGENTPPRKYSCHGEKPDKLNVPSPHFNALSLGPLNASISNIYKSPSVRALRSLFRQNLPTNFKWGVRKYAL